MSYIPDNITDCISEAGMALERGLLVLGELTNDYDFSERPIADLNTANGEASKLIFEYRRLITFIQIAQDYVFKISLILEKARQLDNESRKGGASND